MTSRGGAARAGRRPAARGCALLGSRARLRGARDAAAAGRLGRSGSARTSCSSGCIARSMTEFLTDNPQFADAGRPGRVPGLGAVEGYAATLFALLAVPAGVFAAVPARRARRATRPAGGSTCCSPRRSPGRGCWRRDAVAATPGRCGCSPRGRRRDVGRHGHGGRQPAGARRRAGRGVQRRAGRRCCAWAPPSSRSAGRRARSRAVGALPGRGGFLCRSSPTASTHRPGWPACRRSPISPPCRRWARTCRARLSWVLSPCSWAVPERRATKGATSDDGPASAGSRGDLTPFRCTPSTSAARRRRLPGCWPIGAFQPSCRCHLVTRSGLPGASHYARVAGSGRQGPLTLTGTAPLHGAWTSSQACRCTGTDGADVLGRRWPGRPQRWGVCAMARRIVAGVDGSPAATALARAAGQARVRGAELLAWTVPGAVT